MSFCQSKGKDRVVFLTKEDEIKIQPVALEEKPQGSDKHQYFLPNGEINWNCPCHGNMSYGPCAMEYRNFVTQCVFPKGKADAEVCKASHSAFEKCVSKYPTVYPDLQLDEKLEKQEEVQNSS